jgi:hypothetical protein
MGRFGDDFLRRAADRSLAGVTANNPAEAVYLINFRDADRARFEPDGSYQPRVNAGGLPPVNAFGPSPPTPQQTSSQPGEPLLGSATRSRPDHGPRWRAETAPAGGATGNRTRGQLAANLRSPPMVPHPAAVPAATRGHRRCMGMSSDHPRDLNLNKAPAAERSGRVVEQPEPVSDHYRAARLWAARRAAVSSAPVGARPR